MPPDVAPIRDFEDALRSWQRVSKDVDAVPEDALSPTNLDLLSAASVAIGVSGVIGRYRPAIAKLFDTDIRCVDQLEDLAKALWYLCITNFQPPEPSNQLEAEVPPTRAKLLMWAIPLAEMGIFNKADIDKIREGSGLRDNAGDIVALVAMYRNNSDRVRTVCIGITEEELERASSVGTAVFSAASRREHEPAMSPAQSALRVKKAWTLLDRYYTQCRRAIGYLRYAEGDVDTIAPNLRRNMGSTRRTPEAPAPADNPAPAPVPATGTTPIMAGAPIGGGGSPFVNR